MAKEITRRDFLKGMAAGAVGIASAGVLSACNYTLGDSKNLGKPKASAAAVPVAKPTEPIYKPGTYTSSAKGIGSDVSVTMTFDEYSITDCVIDVSGETPDIGGKIGDQIADAIITGQTADVDAVTGATVTSDAIRTAAADCISQASLSGEAVVLSSKDSAGSADWLGEAPEIPESDIKEELKTEVLVVGCGTGGWIATMTAAEEGAKVLVLEKRETPTGIREDIGSINSRLQLEAFKEFPEFEINKMEALPNVVEAYRKNPG